MSVVSVASLPTVAQQLQGKVRPSALLNVLSVWQGDITRLQADAIVNAANNSLLGGGGVDGAIHRAAGPSLLEECKTLGGCPTGEVRITKGYNLPATYVYHTVGPVGEKPALLKSCYTNTLNALAQHQVRTVAFSSISTGVYGYPPQNAAKLVVETVKDWLQKEDHLQSVDRIIFCVFSDRDRNIYEAMLMAAFA
ncbi:O-acetyl-ADP-ribose deacetylase macrod2 [Dimargaris xerosporica]|nr:O-acetyl-ADP-ribose deacetylase macrod2 [Dimargaris xerosporica]